MTHRTDANHSIIMNNFRSLGYSVFDLSATGNGCPDLLVSKNGENILIEIKTEKGKLSQSQIKFISAWNSAVYLVHDIDDILQLENGMLQPIAFDSKQLKEILK